MGAARQRGARSQQPQRRGRPQHPSTLHNASNKGGKEIARALTSFGGVRPRRGGAPRRPPPRAGKAHARTNAGKSRCERYQNQLRRARRAAARGPGRKLRSGRAPKQGASIAGGPPNPAVERLGTCTGVRGRARGRSRLLYTEKGKCAEGARGAPGQCCCCCWGSRPQLRGPDTATALPSPGLAAPAGRR